MKLKITLWLIAILSCSALGLWQKDNLSIFWREYYSFWHVYEYHKDGFIPKKLLIPPKIAQTDPEAAAVLESVVHWYGEDEPLISIAQYLEKFPQNEKYLSDFVFWLSDNKALDPQIQLMAANELLRLYPENTIYHYLYADSLLANRNSNDINKALETIEQGNRCTDFNMPYDKYKQRVIDLAEKAKLSQTVIRTLNYECPGLNTDNLRKLPLVFANAAFTDGDSHLGTKICDSIHHMQRKQFLAGDPGILATRNLNWSFMPMRFGNWIYPEALELQRANLSKQRAKELRLSLCAWIPEFLLNDTPEVCQKARPQTKEERKADWAARAIFLSPHFGRMFLSLVISVCIFALLCLFFGYSKLEKVGFFKISLFAFACFCFFIVAGRFFMLLLFEEYSHLFDYCPATIQSARIGLSDVLNASPLVSIFLAVPLAFLIILHRAKKRRTVIEKWYARWGKRLLFSAVLATAWIVLLAILKLLCNRHIELEDLILPFIIVFFAAILVSGIARWFYRWKILWLILVSVLFGAFSIMVEGYLYTGYLVMLLFIIFSAVIAVGPAPLGVFPARCLKLVSPFIIIYWLIFVALMPLSAYRIKYETAYRVEHSLPVKRIYALPEPNEALYQRVLARFESRKITRFEAFRFIGLIMPEDLPGILKKFYELPPGFDEMPVVGRSPRSIRVTREPNDINDDYLIRAVMCSGKDVTSILTASMNDPNRDSTLLERAKLGDVSAKQPLEALLAKRIEEGNDFPSPDFNAQWRQQPVKSYEIIAALACVSESNEAAQHYISYIQKHSVSDLFYDVDFLRSVNLLPSSQARIVIKTYLAKVKEWNLPQQPRWTEDPDAALRPLRYIIGIYGDREIAEAVFELMLQSAEQSSESSLFDVSPYFTIESSGLLKKGLFSNNAKFRAWSVWQLRKVGYQFSQQEIDKLMRDESWMVRANAAVAAPQIAKDLTKKDKNPFVRFTASLQN